MTEKRFRLGSPFNGFVDVYDSEVVVASVRVVYAKHLLDLLNSLNDENEQLKSTIKKVIELLSEEVDVFSEKATEHDLNAYKELQQLDNKDAYYMATTTKEAIRILKELME